MGWNLKERFFKWGPVRSVIRLSEEIKPPGFEGLSLHFVAKYFIEGLQKGAVTTRAAAISFRLFLALFPAMFVVFSIIPLLHGGFQEKLYFALENFFPGDTWAYIEPTFNDLIHNPRVTILSFGFILVLIYASNTVNGILLGFNESYNLQKKRNPLILRLLSLVLLLVLTVLLVVAMTMISFSGIVFDYILEYDIVPDEGIIWLLQFAKWIIVIILIYASITILYNVGDFNVKRWRILTAGASFSTLFFILASLGFAYFVQNFANYNKFYGGLSAIFILMIWINFNCIILLLGFELNTSISNAKISSRSMNIDIE